MHGGVRPGVPLEQQAREDLLRMRQPFLYSEMSFGAVVVHGHSPVKAPVVRHNRIAIDTGAVFGGKMTCLVLEGETLGFPDRRAGGRAGVDRASVGCTASWLSLTCCHVRSSAEADDPRQFLAWEEAQELRYEFDGFQPVAMTGGTAHARDTKQPGASHRWPASWHAMPVLRQRSEDRDRRGFRYPDGFVVCSPVAASATVVPEPVVIFEVLSESTAGTDLVTKNHEYAAIASVRRYIVLAQDEMAGTMFERIDDDWVGHLLNAASVLRMPEIGIEVALAELYEGVALPEPERQQS